MLEQVVRAVGQDFVASNCLVPIFFGKQFLEDNSAPARVVVYPTTDRYTAKQAASGQGSGPNIGANPAAVLTRFCSCEISIWASAPINPNPNDQLLSDDSYLAALINQTALSFFRASPGTITFDGGEYTGDTVHVRRGLTYTLKLTIEFPIVDIDYNPPLTGSTYGVISGVGANITTQVRKPDQTVMGSVTFSTRNS